MMSRNILSVFFLIGAALGQGESSIRGIDSFSGNVDESTNALFQERIKADQDRILAVIKREQENYSKNRHLQGFGNGAICNTITGALGNLFTCDCSFTFTGNINYDCSVTEPICVGPVCAGASYSGKVELLQLLGEMEACISPEVAGFDIPSFCVSVVYDLRAITSGGLLCRAEIDGILCTSCNPCNGGIALDCSNIVDDGASGGCELFGFLDGLGLGGASERAVAAQPKTIKPFVPKWMKIMARKQKKRV